MLSIKKSIGHIESGAISNQKENQNFKDLNYCSLDWNKGFNTCTGVSTQLVGFIMQALNNKIW